MRGECGRTHYHAERAETTLQTVAILERSLHGMEFAVPRHPFDSRHRRLVCLHSQDVARLDRAAIQVNCARAALGSIAGDVRARETQLLTEKLDQEDVGFDGVGDSFAVDRQTDAERRASVSFGG